MTTKTQTRTHKSLINARAALAFYVINIILSFYSRKIFIDYLGTEVVGLSVTIQSILQFLNLAELGIGSAVAFNLYKPIAQNNREEIADIVSLQGYLYRKIAYIMLAASAVVICFLPWFLAKEENLVWWYPHATFVVMLAGVVCSYIFNYRQVLLSADLKEYRILIPTQIIRVIKVALQVALLMLVRWEYVYVWWLAVELLATVVTVFIINRNVGKEYKWLHTDRSRGAELRKKYPNVLIKTKQIFFHKIGSFALVQTSVPIIAAYASLSTVTYYVNYVLIVTGITMVVNAIYNSISAGIGNLVADGDKNRIIAVFRELFSSRFLLSSVLCFGVWILSDPFITLWLGEEYLLDNISVALIVATLFINLSRGAVDSFINAYGLFHDMWAPITEATLNVGLAVLLGYFWGLPGILSGVLISLLAIVFSWKPYMLFRNGFKLPTRGYVVMYLKHVAILAVACIATGYIIRSIPIDPAQSWLRFTSYAAITTVMFGVLMGGMLFVSENGMRDFVKRVAFMLNLRNQQ